MSAIDTLATMRQPAVRALALGRMTALMGLQSINIAVSWHLYEVTNSAWSLALVGICLVTPVVLLMIPAGNAADRFPRRNIAMVAHLVLFVGALGLVASSVLDAPIWLIYAMLVVIGSARAFASPAIITILPQLLKPEQFVNANAWVSSGSQVATIMGPTIGGFIIAATGGATWAYVFGAACQLALVLMFLAIPVIPPPPPDTKRTVKDLFAGFAFVRRTPVFLAAITLDMFAVLLGGATALLPIYAKDILQVGPDGLGWLRAAPSLGSLCMAMIVMRIKPFKRPGRVLLLVVAGFGVSIVAFGLSRNFALSLFCLFMTGFFDNIGVVLRLTLEQVLTPDSLRGRVSAVAYVFVSCSNELGAFRSGSVAALLGPVISVVSGGIGTVLVVIAVALIWPELRRIGPLQSLKATELPPPEERDKLASAG